MPDRIRIVGNYLGSFAGKDIVSIVTCLVDQLIQAFQITLRQFHAGYRLYGNFLIVLS